MSRLIQLITVCFLVCSCSGAALKIPDKIKTCGPPLGEYQVTLLGTLPDTADPNMAPVFDKLCPPDVYVGVKIVEKLLLTSSNPLSTCGVHVASNKEEGIHGLITSTNTGLSGIGLVRIPITPELSCLAHFSITYKLLP